MNKQAVLRPGVPDNLLAKLIEAMKAKGVRRGKERDFVRLAERHLSEVRSSVAIATAFAFLCWAWHVRCQCPVRLPESCVCPFRHPSNSWTSAPGALLRSFAMRQNLQITAKNCRLKIHKKPR